VALLVWHCLHSLSGGLLQIRVNSRPSGSSHGCGHAALLVSSAGPGTSFQLTTETLGEFRYE